MIGLATYMNRAGMQRGSGGLAESGAQSLWQWRACAQPESGKNGCNPCTGGRLGRLKPMDLEQDKAGLVRDWPGQAGAPHPHEKHGVRGKKCVQQHCSQAECSICASGHFVAAAAATQPVTRMQNLDECSLQ